MLYSDSGWGNWPSFFTKQLRCDFCHSPPIHDDGKESRSTQTQTAQPLASYRLIYHPISDGKYWRSINFFSMRGKWHEKSIMIIKRESTSRWSWLMKSESFHWPSDESFFICFAWDWLEIALVISCLLFIEASNVMADGNDWGLVAGMLVSLAIKWKLPGLITSTSSTNLHHPTNSFHSDSFTLSFMEKHSLVYSIRALFSYPFSD